ncbi:hypothetical protein CQW23_20187 [Capsicum baccatum]|uniref:GDSL esterase/lipase n=1 Tax=Capsicum baccatum TaxID=33114 RepID=A0A2G2W7W6_CAPBA|nr:hypothetical protein CQW23_20187 [Capsicum baccatum]
MNHGKSVTLYTATGNCLRESLCGTHSWCRLLPYGNKEITGRCSNGMLIVDFIPVKSGLPLLNPYKDRNANFRHGVNFAVSGATALSVESLTEKDIAMSFTHSLLSVQLDWMDSHFKSTCSPDCPKYLKNSLFLVGEIGGDDFNYGLKQGRTIDELRRMRVIGFGATRMTVPGNFPIGCFPSALTKFMTNSATAYDEYCCVEDWNNFIMSYNNHLQQAIDELKREFPDIILIYGDYYNAVALGFNKDFLQKACCGTGRDYNYNECGDPGVEACDDASTYINWDGVHLTQKAYSWLGKWLIDDMLTQLNCHV